MVSKSEQPYKAKANLSVLFGDDEDAPKNFIPIESISLPDEQPRRNFDPHSMQSLIESVKINGILQPILVRPIQEDRYELVAGERRYRAAMHVGLKEAPVVIRELTEQQALQIALVENLQREDLNPVEETEGTLQLLAMQLSTSPDDVIKLLYRMQNDVLRNNDNVIVQPEAQAVNKLFNELGRMGWESSISNRLSLLKLPNDILDALKQGKIEYTKARAIAKIKNEEARARVLERAILEQLSLNQIKEQINLLKTDSQSVKLPEDNLKNQIKDTLSKVNKSKVWSDPKKQKRLQKILTDLESLLAT